MRLFCLRIYVFTLLGLLIRVFRYASIPKPEWFNFGIKGIGCLRLSIAPASAPPEIVYANNLPALQKYYLNTELTVLAALLPNGGNNPLPAPRRVRGQL